MSYRDLSLPLLYILSNTKIYSGKTKKQTNKHIVSVNLFVCVYNEQSATLHYR